VECKRFTELREARWSKFRNASKDFRTNAKKKVDAAFASAAVASPLPTELDPASPKPLHRV